MLRIKSIIIIVNHNLGEYVNGAFTTNGIENFWSLFKHGVSGTHYRISPKHAQKYADEFADRNNKKDTDNLSRVKGLVERLNQ